MWNNKNNRNFVFLYVKLTNISVFKHFVTLNQLSSFKPKNVFLHKIASSHRKRCVYDDVLLVYSFVMLIA